jgi:lipopolysaccharide assembly protein A
MAEGIRIKTGVQNVRILMYFLLLVLILLGITFAVLNSSSVSLNFYVGNITFPLSLLLVFAFAIGCLLGLLVGFWLVLRVKIKNYRLQHQLKVAEKEVENLRAIPLQDRH